MWQWPDLKFCFSEWVAGILGTMTKKHTWDRQEKQRWMAPRLDKGLILVLWYINIEIGWWFKLFIFTSWQVKKTKCLSSTLFPTGITYFIGRGWVGEWEVEQMNTISKPRGTMGKFISFSPIIKAYSLSEILLPWLKLWVCEYSAQSLGPTSKSIICIV